MKSIDKSDHDFERALLHSASRDAPDSDAEERAWMRFTMLTASIAGANATSPGMPTARQTTESAGRLARVMTAAKWVMVGALGGSAVTLGLVAHRMPAHPLASAPLVPSAQTVAVAAPSPVIARPILETEPSATIVDPHPSALSARVSEGQARSRGGSHGNRSASRKRGARPRDPRRHPFLGSTPERAAANSRRAVALTSWAGVSYTAASDDSAGRRLLDAR